MAPPARCPVFQHPLLRVLDEPCRPLTGWSGAACGTRPLPFFSPPPGRGRLDVVGARVGTRGSVGGARAATAEALTASSWGRTRPASQDDQPVCGLRSGLREPAAAQGCSAPPPGRDRVMLPLVGQGTCEVEGTREFRSEVRRTVCTAAGSKDQSRERARSARGQCLRASAFLNHEHEWKTDWLSQHPLTREGVPPQQQQKENQSENRSRLTFANRYSPNPALISDPTWTERDLAGSR